MKKFVLIVSVILFLIGCITIPVRENSHQHLCKISSDMKTLKIVNVAKETNSFYSVSGLILSPILIPTTAIISGTYVVINNVYHLGKERLTCGKDTS